MHTNWKNWIKEMDFKSTSTRRQHVLNWLHNHRIPYFLQQYTSGVNVYVKLGDGPTYFAVSCHLDKVPGSGGANDNGAAIATCLALAEHFYHRTGHNVLLLFFDEEETGLKGSRAYVKEFGFEHIHTLVNLELVGAGQHPVLWPVKKQYNRITERMISFLEQLNLKPWKTWLLDCGVYESLNYELITTMSRFPMYYSDGFAFEEKGFDNVITLTRIHSNDLELLHEYKRLHTNGASEDAFFKVLSTSAFMKWYHTAGDNYYIIEENVINDNIALLKVMIAEEEDRLLTLFGT